MYRFHPQWQTARQMVQQRPHRQAADRSTRTFPITTTIRKTSATSAISAAAALMDIGCYPISVSRFIFDAEPTRVLGHGGMRSEHADRPATSGVLEFFQGTATFTCSTQLCRISG